MRNSGPYRILLIKDCMDVCICQIDLLDEYKYTIDTANTVTISFQL